jgi:dTMP kinase
MFITLEGGEGAGKTTQALRLVDRLCGSGRAARFTREPGGTALADAIRAVVLHPEGSLQALATAGLAASAEMVEPTLPITEVLLLSAARAQHVQRIRTWLAAGELVVCDRFADSTRVYQGMARGVAPEEIAAAEQLATGGLRPDLTLLFELPVAEGLGRKQHVVKRSLTQLSLFEPPTWNRLDRESLDFYERVHAGYLALAAAEPERWVVVDAMLPPDELAECVWQVVAARLATT